MAVAAVTCAASDAGEAVPVGPFTRARDRGVPANGRGRRTAPPRPGPRPDRLTADECAAILATCMQRRRTARGILLVIFAVSSTGCLSSTLATGLL